MSTIFGAIFFVILILMGFNLMTWNFLQYDAYNGVVTSMKQRDQQTASENLAATAPGATGFSGNSFNITEGNTGGVSVTVTRVYIFKDGSGYKLVLSWSRGRQFTLLLPLASQYFRPVWCIEL